MKEEQQEGNSQPSPKQAVLFISCPGCNAVLAAGSKSCKTCGNKLQGKGKAPNAASPTAQGKKRKRDDGREQDLELQQRHEGSGNGGSDEESKGSSVESTDSSSADSESDADSPSGSSSEAKTRRSETDHAVVQPDEKVDCLPFDCSKKGYTNPMVEIRAGVNIWHQVRVHKETVNELRISYPGKGDRAKREWLKRTSSRLWRGPMAQRFWVCTDKTRGRWRPKAPEEGARKGGKRKRAGSQRPAKPKRASAGPGDTTEGTGTQTGASMGGYSGADEQTPKQASSARAHQDRAEASSKPAQQLADAGSSEPPAGQLEGGPGRPAPKDAPAQRGVEPAIHSNSGKQLETERAGSMPGISSKDEVQAVEAETPMAEAEQGAALVAWFRAHYAKLDGQRLLYTQLDGAGPEIGVRQEQPPAKGLAPPQQAGAVAEGPRDGGLRTETWQPRSLQKLGSGVVHTGSPDQSLGARQHSASTAQQARPGASQHRREVLDQPQKPFGQVPQPDELPMQNACSVHPAKKAKHRGAAESSGAQKEKHKGSEHKRQLNGLGKGGHATFGSAVDMQQSEPHSNPSKAQKRQGAKAADLGCPRPKQTAAKKGDAGARPADRAASGSKKSSSQSLAKPPGHSSPLKGGGKQLGKPAQRGPNKDASPSKGRPLAKSPQQRTPTLTLEPTDMFL